MTSLEKINQLLLAAEILEKNAAFSFSHPPRDLWHPGELDNLECNILTKKLKKETGVSKSRNKKQKELTPEYLRLAANLVDKPWQFRETEFNIWRDGENLENSIRFLHQIREK